jgi:hypothetical protein
VAAYDVSEWSELFVATAGAAAALAGLVFVAVSINIDRILKLPGIPERALEAVATLIVVVVVSIAGLIPGQSTVALGIELLVIAAVYASLVARLRLRAPAKDEPFLRVMSRATVRGFAVIPLLVGAVTLLAEAGGGLYWIAGGLATATVASVANAWVLLVEILR